MSAVWLKLVSILCLSCTALSGPVSSGVVWRDVGGSITIQCRPPGPGQEYLSLKKGLSEELEVFYRDGTSKKNNVADEFGDRLQLHGVFPDMDILIKNLTSDDTGPYWCLYKKFDPMATVTVRMKGNGSVLLVVRGSQLSDDVHHLYVTSTVDLLSPPKHPLDPTEKERQKRVYCGSQGDKVGHHLNQEFQHAYTYLLTSIGWDKAQQCDPSNSQLILVSLVICSAVLFGIVIVFLVWIIRKTKTYTTKKPRRVPNNEVYEDMRGTIRR